MSRLTEFRDGIWGLSVDAVREGYDRYSVFSRLAAYEDIGLEPKQVRKIANVLQEVGQEYNCRFEFVAEVVEKYAKYVDAERDGRLVVLPCKVGDTVYRVSAVGCGDNVYHCDKPCNGTWENCNSYDESLRIDEIPFSYFRIPDIGKTIFLTREEAEAALKGDSQ